MSADGRDGLSFLAEKLDEDIAVMQDDLGLGKAKDFGDYKFSCGIIRGLLTSKNHIIELAQRMETEDE